MPTPDQGPPLGTVPAPQPSAALLTVDQDGPVSGQRMCLVVQYDVDERDPDTIPWLLQHHVHAVTAFTDYGPLPSGTPYGGGYIRMIIAEAAAADTHIALVFPPNLLAWAAAAEYVIAVVRDPADSSIAVPPLLVEVDRDDMLRALQETARGTDGLDVPL